MIESKKPVFERHCVTLGEQAEIHSQGFRLGKGLREGFTAAELKQIQMGFDELGASTHLALLSDQLHHQNRTGNEAAFLVVRRATQVLMAEPDFADRTLTDLQGVRFDDHYFDTKKQKTLHKHARHNVVFADHHIDHSDDYKQCTVVGHDRVPHLHRLIVRLTSVLGPKASHLQAEGNRYFERDSYIGWHGDRERKVVIGISLGSSMTLAFHWIAPGTTGLHGHPMNFTLNHGDVYIMSEKCSGFDWRCTSHFRLVHAAAFREARLLPKPFKAIVRGQKTKKTSTKGSNKPKSKRHKVT